MQSLLAILGKTRLMVGNRGRQGCLDELSGNQHGTSRVRPTKDLCLLMRSCRGEFREHDG